MRKLIISGCSNCPYLKIWNDGEGKGHNSVTRGTCDHPSFNKQLLRPGFPSTVFFQYTVESVDGERLEDSEVFAIKPGGIPEWCPLPWD